MSGGMTMRVALKMTPVAEYTYWKGRASMKIFQISPATGRMPTGMFVSARTRSVNA